MPALPRETLRYRFYDALDADQTLPLRDLLDRASPILDRGNRYHGYARWRVNWQFDWKFAADGTVELATQQVEAVGSILLPRLETSCLARRQAFEHYLDCLRTHELGHFEFARQAAARISRSLHALDRQSSVARLIETADRGAHAILAEARQAERQYDADTSHGRSQGALLP